MFQKKISRKKCWEYLLNFQQIDLSKLEKVHVFQKKDAINELNIFFLNKSKRIFYDKTLMYK